MELAFHGLADKSRSVGGKPMSLAKVGYVRPEQLLALALPPWLLRRRPAAAPADPLTRCRPQNDAGLDDVWQKCGKYGPNGYTYHDANGAPVVDEAKFPSMKVNAVLPLRFEPSRKKRLHAHRP